MEHKNIFVAIEKRFKSRFDNFFLFGNKGELKDGDDNFIANNKKK
jgi:hypothetical protein